MAETKDIVKLAVDNFHGKVENYSASEAAKVLTEALIAANNGSTKLNYRDIRDGKCNGLFTLIEQILDATVVEGLQDNDFFMDLVDFRNVALGDAPVFVTEDSNLFVVSEVADGTQGLRRQRLAGRTEYTVPTKMHAVKIYEELNRILSGRVDFNEMINKVAESFQQEILNEIFTVWTNVTANQLGGAVYYTTSGSYTEADLLDVIAHVEAAAGGKTATVMGTKKALRNLVPGVVGNTAREDLYLNGFYGHFYGSPVIALPNRHQVGTTNLILPDDALTIVAGDAKPIKMVYEGEPLVIMGDPLANADLTQNYMYGAKYGIGVVLDGGMNTGIGKYEW